MEMVQLGICRLANKCLCVALRYFASSAPLLYRFVPLKPCTHDFSSATVQVLIGAGKQGPSLSPQRTGRKATTKLPEQAI
jgi:hypothetical protein